MEAIGAIIGIFIVIFVVRLVIGASVRTVGAAAKSVVGKGTFSENMELAFKGMGAFEVRFNDTTMDDDDPGSPLVKQIEVKGLFPVARKTNVGFVISVLDDQGDGAKPVLAMFEGFQEPDTIAFQHATELGAVSPDQGFVSWARVGVVIPGLLQPPKGGNQTLTTVIRLVDLDNPPKIEFGFAPSGSSILWQRVLKFQYNFEDKGYEEAEEHREEARALAIKIGMAVAMADGTLDDSEGETIKNWIKREISPYGGAQQNALKNLYNETMKAAYTEAKNGDLSLSAATARLNEIGEKKSRYDAIELCFDIMAADGVADASEMQVIRKVADALELDIEEIESLRDKKIVGLNTTISQDANAEELLGIESGWDEDRIKKHLRQEFQKWNNRLNTLPEGDERINAQRMLDLIANTRKKYG